MSNDPIPVISIVIPFFNVEEYVDDCLRSVIYQSFEEPYEVICVDDGSCDKTGALLDSWAASYARIHVAHTENAGLSEARNVGVRMAAAPLVSFVDGDDVVSPHYLRLLYDATRQYDGIMVIGRCRELCHEDVASTKWSAGTDGMRMLSRDEAIRLFLKWEIDFVAWGKLAPKDLYLHEPFEPGVLYEDSYAFPSHLSAVAEVILLDAVIYGHVARKGSISRPLAMTKRHAEDKLKTIEHFRVVAASWPPELKKLSIWRIDRHLVRLVDIAAGIADRKVARRYIRLAREALVKGFPEVLRIRHEESLSWKLPMACACAIVSPRLLHLLVNGYACDDVKN